MNVAQALQDPAVVAAQLATRNEYTQNIINGVKGLTAVLPSTDHSIPNIPSQPGGYLSMQFGSSWFQDRTILVQGGRIQTSGSKVVISVSKKSPDTVTRVTAFLQTEFPYGGKIGGVLYSLVSLIPRVIKGLPGTVTISS